MSLVERVKEEAEGSIRYYEEKVVELKKRLPFFVTIAERLDQEGLDPSFYGSTFSYFPDTAEEAFRITGKLLELFPEIERFTKQFDGGRSEPTWRWVGGITENNVSVQFSVFGASPEEDCLPRQAVHSYKTWVCEKRGGVR